MKWYQLKEQAAGEKRLMLLWCIYKIAGKQAVQFITFFVAFFAFCFSGEIKKYTKKNLSAVYEFTKDKNAKPSLVNRFRLVLNYALSLVDKMEIFAGRFALENISFFDNKEEKKLIKDLENNTGIFFITSHIGNIDVLRTFIANPKLPFDPHVNVFLSKNQCRIFNDFLKKIKKEDNTTTFPVESISVDTAIELKDRLDRGEIAFMAGDRISCGSSNITLQTLFLNKKTELPAGTFKLAQLTEKPVYFICAIKTDNDKYTIYLKKTEQNQESSKNEILSNLQKDYILFLEEMTETAPLQFYHFYDIFEKN